MPDNATAKPTLKQLAAENAELRARLNEAEETLHAIQSGEVDALVLSTAEGDNIFELKTAQEPYRTMVEAMEEGAVTLAPDGTILYANRRFADWVGVVLGQIVGLSMREMIADQDRAGFDAMLARGAVGAVREALTLQAADGRQMPVQFSMSPLPQAEGRAISVIIADLSEEASAAEARSRLALIVESSDDSIVSTTLDGVVESWNRAAEKLYGYPAGEAIGQSLGALIAPPEHFHEIEAELDAIRQRKRTRISDTVRLHKDGSLLEVSIKASPILDDAGNVVGASINARDISERKRAEEERDRAAYLLGERLKELRCLYTVSTTLEDRGLSIEQAMRRVVESIPLSFQYPEVTCACLTLHGEHYRSGDCMQTPWRLTSPIVLAGEEVGELLVRYTEERPACDEGPFLREERNLLDSIARMLTDYLRLDLAISQLQQFRDLLDDSNDSVFVIEPGTARILDVNERACTSMGYSRDELLRMKVTDIEAVIPSKATWDGHVKELKKAGAMLVEGEERRKDGSTFPVEVSVQYVARQENEYIVTIVRDISERKDAEEALRISREWFRAIFSQAPLGIAVIDSHTGKIYEVNSRFAEIAGRTIKEMATIDWMSITHPDDVQEDLNNMALMNAGKIPGFSMDKRYRRPNGSFVWIKMTIVPLRGEKNISPRHLCMIDDISERKQAEDELRDEKRFSDLLVESLPDIFYLMDRQGNLIRWNNNLLVVSGRPPEEMAEANALDFVDEKDRPLAALKIREAFETGSSSSELNLTMKDGVRLYTLSGFRIQTEKGVHLIGIGVDISQRKQAEQLLKQERDFNKRLVDVAPVIILTLDLQGGIVTFNRYMEELGGYLLSEVEGQSWIERFVPEAQRAETEEIFQRAIRGVPTIGNVTPLLTRSGEERQMEWFDKTLKDEKGQIQGLISIGLDVTDKIKSREALEESEQRFQLAMEGANDGLWDWNLLTDEVYYSPRWFTMLGYTPEAFPPVLDTWARLVHPDDREEMLQRVQDYLEGRVDHVEHEMRMKHQDGHDVIVLSRAIKVLRKSDAKPVRLVGTHVDITRRKQDELALRKSQQDLSEAQHMARIGSWERDLSDVMSWSDEMYAILEFDRERAPSLEAFLETVHPHDRDKVGQSIAGTQQGHEGDEVEYRLQMPDGRIKEVQQRTRHEFDEAGRSIHSVGTLQDISQMHEMESRLRQSQKMEAVGTLVGGIAHDFNNKLAAITGNLYLAQRTIAENPEAIGRLKAVEQLSFEAASMVQQLLTFARKGKVQQAPLTLVTFIKEAVKLNRVAIPENIHFSLDYGQDPLPVMGDITQLQQLFLNLLTNARDALADTEDPRIDVALQAYTPDAAFCAAHPEAKKVDAYACLQVKDNGSGIEPKDLEHIFDPFFTTKEVGKGTGLGLAMVYGALQTHQGIIDVESTPGEGTTFSIFLPLIREMVTRPAEKKADESISGHGETILMADDDANVRETFAEALKAMGYQVIVAVDGAEAVELYRKHRDEIALTILDVVMPGLKGPAAAKQIRELNPDARILFATGYDSRQSLASDESDVPVLEKPYRFDVVSQVIVQALGRSA